jgi:hypothetical protein
MTTQQRISHRGCRSLAHRPKNTPTALRRGLLMWVPRVEFRTWFEPFATAYFWASVAAINRQASH